LTDTGGVKCWGRNSFGELGNGATADSEFPVDVIEPANDFLDVKVSGDVTTCAQTRAGDLKCWGWSGNQGNGLLIPASAGCRPVDIVSDGCTKPALMPRLSESIAAISFGQIDMCIIARSGVVRCWGNNTYGELGDGTTIQRPFPGIVVKL
jgi:alpha-tubulin suppressor-like RCC1 family protein